MKIDKIKTDKTATKYKTKHSRRIETIYAAILRQAYNSARQASFVIRWFCKLSPSMRLIPCKHAVVGTQIKMYIFVFFIYLQR